MFLQSPSWATRVHIQDPLFVNLIPFTSENILFLPCNDVLVLTSALRAHDLPTSFFPRLLRNFKKFSLKESFLTSP